MKHEDEEFSALIDGSEQYFRAHLLGRNVGYLNNLHNLLVSVYNQLLQMDKDLVEKTAKLPDGEDKQSHLKTIEGLISKMLRVEQRVFIIREVIKDLEIEV